MALELVIQDHIQLIAGVLIGGVAGTCLTVCEWLFQVLKQPFSVPDFCQPERGSVRQVIDDRRP